MVININDINEEFAHLNAIKVTPSTPALQEQQKIDPLLQYIDFHQTTLEQLLQRTGLDIINLQNQLIELEITGRITVTAEGYIKR